MHVLYFKGNISDHGMINVRAVQMFDNKTRCRRCDGSTCSTLALPVSTPMPTERWDKTTFCNFQFSKIKNKQKRSIIQCIFLQFSTFKMKKIKTINHHYLAQVRPARAAAGFRGTVRYASINAHKNKEMGE